MKHKTNIPVILINSGGILNARQMLRVLFFQEITKEQTIMDSME